MLDAEESSFEDVYSRHNINLGIMDIPAPYLSGKEKRNPDESENS
ncbi:MAG: hypothetical protein ACK2TU_01320 [Anaerolineales bacterium]